jgi:hypothetical protein
MKKILLLVLPLVCVTLLMASHLTPVELMSDVNIMYGGEFRTRAIMLNDLGENDGGWFDNRLRFDLAAKLGDRLGIAWNTEVGDIVWADYGTKNVAVETRELYLDYTCAMTGMKVRLGQQYWYDHRSLVLDDYFSGITTDFNIAGIPTELGFIKAYEGAVNQLDDTHVAFANFAFKTPVDWGITAMWGQCHDAKEADFWVIPYFMLNFEPVNLDLTAVINQQMFKDELGDDDSELGIAIAAKADVDLGVKVGADFLMATKEGINTLSPYYENGLYILGNKLPYDGVQLDNLIYAPYNAGQAYMSIVGKIGYPISEKMDLNAAFGMASLDDPMGMEVNVGIDYKVIDKLTFNPVLAICMPDEDFWGNDNMIYMLGGLLKAEF